ncbi:hypothetical protein [Serratia fonticola]
MFEYVCQHYGVPACLGREVMAYGQAGIIVKDLGHYIGVALVDDPRQQARPYHPVDGMVYGGMTEPAALPQLKTWRCLPPWKDCWFLDAESVFTVTAETRNKARYQAFLYLTQDCELELEREALLGIKVRRAGYR